MDVFLFEIQFNAMSVPYGVLCRKAIISKMRKSIPMIIVDMEAPSLSVEDRREIQTRCADFINQWRMLKEADALINEEDGALELTIELVELFDSYIDLTWQ